MIKAAFRPCATHSYHVSEESKALFAAAAGGVDIPTIRAQMDAALGARKYDLALNYAFILGRNGVLGAAALYAQAYVSYHMRSPKKVADLVAMHRLGLVVYEGRGMSVLRPMPHRGAQTAAAARHAEKVDYIAA